MLKNMHLRTLFLTCKQSIKYAQLLAFLPNLNVDGPIRVNDDLASIAFCGHSTDWLIGCLPDKQTVPWLMGVKWTAPLVVLLLGALTLPIPAFVHWSLSRGNSEKMKRVAPRTSVPPSQVARCSSNYTVLHSPL